MVRIKGDARDQIELVNIKFTGGLAIQEDGTPYVPHPADVRYVGDPNKYPEIDENWEDLVYGK